MPSTKLSNFQRAQLAGLASARIAGPKGMAARGAKGGRKTAETRGREHFIRAAHKRWGRLGGPAVEGVKPTTAPAVAAAAAGKAATP